MLNKIKYTYLKMSEKYKIEKNKFGFYQVTPTPSAEEFKNFIWMNFTLVSIKILTTLPWKFKSMISLFLR